MACEYCRMPTICQQAFLTRRQHYAPDERRIALFQHYSLRRLMYAENARLRIHFMGRLRRFRRPREAASFSSMMIAATMWHYRRCGISAAASAAACKSAQAAAG